METLFEDFFAAVKLMVNICPTFFHVKSEQSDIGNFLCSRCDHAGPHKNSPAAISPQGLEKKNELAQSKKAYYNSHKAAWHRLPVSV